MNFIQAGGQQPAITQQPVAGFKPVGHNNNTPINSSPGFGGSQKLGATGGNTLFGGQSSMQLDLFPITVSSAPQTVSTFGNTQQPNTLFGAQQQQINTLFNTGQNNTLFQTNPSNVQQPQQNSLFGSNPSTNPAANGTLFGQTNNQSNPGGLFNSSAPLQAPPSFFNQPAQGQMSQPQSNSLFGAPTTGNSLFGQGQTTSQTSNFAQALGTAVGSSASGFTPNLLSSNSQPITNAGQNPSLLGQLASPLYQNPPGQVDQATQLLLPHLLMNYIISQPQQSLNSATGNRALDALNNLVMSMNQNKSNQIQNSSNNLLNPTPFD